jgi:hypothetical protein
LIFPGFLGDMTPHSFSRIFIELVVSSNGKAYFKKFSYRGLSKLLFIVLTPKCKSWLKGVKSSGTKLLSFKERKPHFQTLFS